MPRTPHDVIAPNEKRHSLFSFAPLFALLAFMFLSACAPLVQEPIAIEPPKAPEPVKAPEYSSEPLLDVETLDIRFAQHALTKVGYRIGKVDGLWGPRSAASIRLFESKRQLASADGHLSELNLHALEIASGISREDYGKLPQATPTVGIKAKLNKKTPLSAGPQLIIVDREYKVLSKPNPYSTEVLTLASGTGIYVISEQDNYFEVESINRKRGYIKAD